MKTKTARLELIEEVAIGVLTAMIFLSVPVITLFS